MVANQDTCQLKYKSWILSAAFVYKQFQNVEELPLIYRRFFGNFYVVDTPEN